MADPKSDYLAWKAGQAAATPQSAYDTYRNAEREATTARAGVAIEQSRGVTDPVGAVQRQDAARAAGRDLPAQMLADPEGTLSTELARHTRQQQLAQSSELSRWVAEDPINAALAERDLQSLSLTAGLLESAGKGLDSTVSGAWYRNNTKTAEDDLQEFVTRRADRERSFGDIMGAIGDDLKPEDIDQNIALTAVEGYAEGVQRYLSSRLTFRGEEAMSRHQEELSEAVAAALGLEGDNNRRIGATYGRSANSAKIAGAVSDISKLERAGDQVSALGSLIAENPAAFTEWLANVTIESGPAIAAAGVATAATRRPAVGAAVLGASSLARGESGAFAALVEENGYDLSDPAQRQALLQDPAVRQGFRDRAFTYGAVIAMMDAVSGGVASRTMVDSAAGNLVLQAFTQATMGSAGETLALLASDQKLSAVDIIVEGLAGFADAPLEVAALGRRVATARRQVSQDQKFFKALAEGAEGSGTRTQAPRKYRDLVAKLTADGPVETLHVDARGMEQLFQSGDLGATAEQFIKALPGGDIDAYTRALEVGGTVEIPTAVYATDIVGTDFDGLLRDHIKTAPERMSAAEARAYEAQADELSELARVTAEEVESGQRELEAVVETARLELVSSLQRAGRSPQVAEREALQAAAFVSATSQRLGMTAEAFLQRYPMADVRGALQSDEAAVEAETVAAVSQVRGEAVDPYDLRDAMDAQGLTGAEPVAEIAAAYETYNAPGRLRQDDATAAPITDTPEFKAWFGDSKVVDENGAPLVVYHGTQSANLEAFDARRVGARDSGWYGEGFYFTPREETAEDYAYDDDGDAAGSVVAAYVSLQNPYYVELTKDGWSETRADLASMGVGTALRTEDNLRGAGTFTAGPDAKRLSARLKARGHDGVVVRDDYGVAEIVAFDPTQIKSVDNKGTFDGADPRIMYQGQTLDPVNGTRRLPDLERASPGPVPGVRETASRYMAKLGLPVRHQNSYVKVGKERATKIAQLYDDMDDAPNDPEVKAAYQALADETIAQYEALLELGYTFEFIDFAATGDPYASPREAIVDMQENKHLWVFPTSDGFGTVNEASADNPLLAMTDHVVDGRKTQVNDLFRIVHDVFGHGSEGAAFGARGEENAWQAHVRMFTPLAARAMTTETRGQNSWVNFGPYGEANRTNPKDTVFADQKVGLLPKWVSEVGQADDAVTLNQAPVPVAATPAMPVNDDGTVTLTHWSDEKRDVISPSKAGSGPLRGAERNRRGPGKAFFGLAVGKLGGYRKESLGFVRHTAKVPLTDLYDLTADPDGFFAAIPADVPRMQRLGWVEEAVQAAGHKGYYVTEGPQGMSAAMFVDVKPDRTRRDRVPARPFSAVDLMRQPMELGGSASVLTVAEGLTDRHNDVFSRELEPGKNEDDYRAVLASATDELRTQLREANSGIGWYSKDVGESLAIASEVFPTLATTQHHRDLFLTFAAIFSNGMTPQQAFSLSAEAFEAFLADGAVPVRRGAGKWGVRDNNNRAQLQFVSYLADKLGGVEHAMDWLKDFHPRADIDAIMVASGYHKKGRFVTQKAKAGPDMPGLLVFGEKLGRYAMGLHGFDIDAADVTIDMWYIRTYRRLVGGLLRGPLGGEGIVAGPTEADRTVIRRLTADMASALNKKADDVQAVMWFFEKRLWGAQGLNTNEGTNSDGARQLVEKYRHKSGEAAARETDDGVGGDAPDQGYNPDYDEFFQRDKAGPRGSILLPRNGGQPPVVDLFQGADLSTFLHESGHYYLHVLQDLAARGEMTGTITGDWVTIKKWWRDNTKGVAEDAGVTQAQVKLYLRDGTTGDIDVDRKVNVGMHEQWARAYEAYLLEGKAPSNALRSAFEAFSAWLTSTYRRVKGDLNVQLSDEMREVFDRLLATDDEIAAVAAENAMTPMAASADKLGITSEEYEGLRRLGVEAEDEARQGLLAEIMAPIRRQRTAEYREERKKVQREIAAEVNAKPANRLREWVGNSRWLGEAAPEGIPLDLQMNRAAALQDHDEGLIDALPRGKRLMVADKGTVHPDDVAGWFGYRNASEMFNDAVTSPNATKEIASRTKSEMRRRYGDPLGDGNIEEVALKALHGDKRAQLIAAELRALNKTGRKGRTTTRSQAREIARRTLRGMQVRKAVRSGQYLQAERRASERSQQLVAKGDLDGAYEAKREQLVNNAMYMESKLAAEELAKAERTVAALRKKSVRAKLAGEYLDAIDDVLTTYDFKKSVTGKEEARRTGLQDYIASMKEQGRENELAVPQWVMDRLKAQPYRTLTVAELGGVTDTLLNIQHTARMKQKLRDARAERDMVKVVTDMVAEMDANVKDNARNRVKTPGEKRGDGLREFANLLLNADSLLRKLGGFRRGAAFAAIKAPVDAAADWASERRRMAGEELEALYKPYSRSEKRRMAVKRYTKELGGSFSKWDLVSAALNMGNADNLARLMDKDSDGFNAAQVDFIKRQLSQRDWEFVQSAWDYVNTYWADIAARERRLTGTTPRKVEATEVVTPYGTFDGGYYPIVYDGDLSGVVSAEDIAETQQRMMAGRFGKAQTSNGHLQERAKGSGGRSLQLGIEILHQHVGSVIHDLSYSEAVTNAWRVLQREEVRTAFERKGLLKDHQALEMWLQDTATGQMTAGGVAGRVAMRAKNGFTLSKLAMNLSTVALQVTGLTQSMVVVGHRNFAMGVSDYLRRPAGAVADMLEVSPFMRERQGTFDRDVNDMMGDIAKGPTSGSIAQLQDVMARAGFWAMTKVQFYSVDTPTWYAGYRQGLKEYGGDEVKARANADRSVARAQASGVFSDRSAFERGTLSHDTRHNGFIKLFTTLGSYMFAKGNVAYEVAGRTRRDIDGVNVRSLAAALRGAMDMTLLFTVEALAYQALRGGLPDDDAEDEEWAAFIAKETALSAMSVVPGVRDLGSSLSGFDAGAYGSVMSTLGRPLFQMSQGEVDAALLKSISSALGVFTGLPTGQLNKTADAWYRLEQGEDISPLEFLMGAKR